MKFQRISEGLVNNRISGIYQDSFGYMWIATYSGLHRYDGLDFKVYTTSEDPNSINDNFIGALMEDKKKRLWVGTGDGVGRYVRETDDFVRYKLNSDFKIKFGESNLTNTILEDREGKIWASSIGSGLFLLDEKTQTFVPQYTDKITNIQSMAFGPEGSLWLATSNQGLVELDPEKNEINFHRYLKDDIGSISSDDVRTVAFDQDGRLWAGTRNAGLNRMQKAEGKTVFVRYTHSQEDPGSLYNNNIYRLYPDNLGNFWSCNENGGLHLYQKESDSFVRYLHDPKNPHSLTHNSVWNIFQDAQGRYWVGTAHSGINLADPYASKFAHYFKNPLHPNSLNNDIIRDFLETKEGNVWVATDGGGLNYFNREEGTFTAFRHDSKNPKSLGSDAVICLKEDEEGRLWVGTWAGGLHVLKDQQKGEFQLFNEYIQNSSHPIKNVFDVHFDAEFIWIAALNEGLYRYDRKNARLELFSHDENDPESISSNMPVRIMEDSKGHIWVGTQAGLSKINKGQKGNIKFINYFASEQHPYSLPGNTIRHIVEDSKKRVWIATDRGLSRYNSRTDDFKTYREKDGLPINEINSIVEDNEGYLWIGTIKGISRFDAERELFVNFDKNDGLSGNEFSRYAVLKTKKGELLFGGLNGFNLFDPSSLQYNPYAPPVYLSDLKIFNKSVNFRDQGSFLQKHIGMTDTLSLSYKENVLSFDFIALNFTHPEQNQYAYILEGFEKEWNYVGNQRNATYTNLDPGTYIFKVKAANNDGIWNETGSSLIIKIAPPFWKTLWFIALATLFSIALILGLFRLRVQSIKKQNKQLEKKVEERTTLLKHTNSELKKHIQEKDKLFSIIGHDLRNPFISIIGYLEILEEEFENSQNSEQLTYIKHLLNVSRNTHNLLENLLLWASQKIKMYELKAEPVQLDKLLDTALSMASPQALYKKIKLEKSCPKDIHICADKNMILTVLRNLMSNAIKFSRQGSKIEISATEMSGNVVISVRDYGRGMAEEVLKGLFDLSEDQSQGKKSDFGTGLGLLLCKEFVKKHAGDIWAESTPGEGSTFHISLSKHEVERVAV
ncbi:sensor histidine kinase [Arthrospiribacter ruber]|uniref:sensor histidine kinase n=1 Tax=Arthrospiribacter ruber TaxID=2487934 RepID=UPI001C5AA1E0|nr:sensor histidine kinase [Arthrospiribacter ruber]